MPLQDRLKSIAGVIVTRTAVKIFPSQQNLGALGFVLFE